MKKYSQEEREKTIKEIEKAPINLEDWEGPHETKIISFKYVEDTPGVKKKGFLFRFFDKIKAVLHPS